MKEVNVLLSEIVVMFGRWFLYFCFFVGKCRVCFIMSFMVVGY